jgi:hypothetical protein
MVPPRTAPARRFSLLDGMGLIAALGVGLALGAKYHRCLSVFDSFVRTEPNNVRVPGPREWVYACVPSLIAVTVLLWPLRLVPPRPPSRRWTRLPGLTGSYVAASALAIASAKAAVVWPGLQHNVHFADVGMLSAGETIALRVVAAKDMIGPAIAVSWLILWLGGGWRPEPTWIDRAGRVLGVVWLVLGLAGWVDAMLRL